MRASLAANRRVAVVAIFDQLPRVFYSDSTDLIIIPKRLSMARFSASEALLNACSRISFW
jgi:uncharacterized protein (DUF924 family)